MPRAFNETEEKQIRLSLRETGRDLFERHGITKTSIDEITSAALISKGSFYKFYPSKEALFFELLEDTQNRVRAPLITPIEGEVTRNQFENLLEDVITQIQNQPMLRFLGNAHELRTIARKIPPDRLTEHRQKDQAFLDQLIDRWNHKPSPPERDAIAAHMAMLLIIQYSDIVLGERLYPFAKQAIVTSFTNCFFD